MKIDEAIRALVGNTDLMAVLPGERGQVPALYMGQGMQVLDVRNGKERRWIPKYTDLVSIEWSVIQISVQAKLAEQARAAAAKGQG